MSDRRMQYTDLSPLSEDWGIFKNSIVTVNLALSPLRRETSRGDLLCAGFQDDTRVEVVFPGRRRAAAKALEAELDRFLKTETDAALSRGMSRPHAINIRFPLQASGIWRTRLSETEEEEWERVYQFMSACWTYSDHLGRAQTFGDMPKVRPVTRIPVA